MRVRERDKYGSDNMEGRGGGTLNLNLDAVTSFHAFANEKKSSDGRSENCFRKISGSIRVPPLVVAQVREITVGRVASSGLNLPKQEWVIF